jgi:hypothetical protein
MLRVGLQGQGAPAKQQREALEDAFGRVLLRELVTSEALDVAYRASRQGSTGYWAEQWHSVRARAMAEVFPDGLPGKTQVRVRFSYSPWQGRVYVVARTRPAGSHGKAVGGAMSLVCRWLPPGVRGTIRPPP